MSVFSSDYVESFRIAQRLFRRFGHRQQTALIVGFGCDLLRHDDAVLGIDCGLHVVGGRMPVCHTHEPRFRLGIVLQLLQRSCHSALINGDFLLLIGVFQLIQVTLHGFAFSNRLGAAYGAELRAVNRYPLALHQPAIRTNSAPAAVTASRCTRRNSASDL